MIQPEQVVQIVVRVGQHVLVAVRADGLIVVRFDEEPRIAYVAEEFTVHWGAPGVAAH